MSRITVNMRTCDHVHHIEVIPTDDGDFDVHIESDCPHVVQYGEKLGRLSMEDALDFCTSRINDPEIRQPLSATCLCPIGVMNALWLECGMLTKTICHKAGTNDIVLDQENQ